MVVPSGLLRQPARWVLRQARTLVSRCCTGHSLTRSIIREGTRAVRRCLCADGQAPLAPLPLLSQRQQRLPAG